MLSTQSFTVQSAPAQFGCGASAQLPALLATLGADRILLVTDPGLVGAGISDRVINLLSVAALETAVFDGVASNPSTHTLDAGAAAARTFEPRVIVALGGGSVLDAAKGIALMAVNDGPAESFDYRNEQEHPGIAIVAIPTTAGTGAETNGFGVIDHHEMGRKFYVGHPSTTPRAVILDPELTTGLPPGATAATGMDVLTHALESLSSVRANPYADGINRQVVHMVFHALPGAVQDGADLEARSHMLLAAHMAGLAFATTGLGMAHALAHALSARLGAAHGVALAVLLDHILAFNLPVRAPVYAQLMQSAGMGSGDLEEDAQAAVDAVRTLSRSLGMPHSLGELGLRESHIPQIVEDALVDEVMANTPRMPDAGELQVLLRGAM